MHKGFRTMTLVCLGAPLFLMAQSSNVTLPQDKGSDKINVSAYPPEQQKGYKVFADKCSKCHTIGSHTNTIRPRAEWSRYVKRMMHKPNSGISDAQGKTIYEFLAYDQENRKDKNPSAFSKSLSDEEIEKLKAQQH